MTKLIFDTKQEETTLSTTGRVLICVNEQEIQVWETPESGSEEEPAAPVLVTKYQYDTIWIKPIKQTAEEILKAFKKARIDEVNDYDVSDDVNSFTLMGRHIWLSVDTRLALGARLSAEQKAGKTTTSIWYNGYEFNLGIAEAIDLLSDLEIYASTCYDVTAQHKVDILTKETIAEVGAYDITADYPDNPVYLS